MASYISSNQNLSEMNNLDIGLEGGSYIELIDNYHKKMFKNLQWKDNPKEVFCSYERSNNQ